MYKITSLKNSFLKETLRIPGDDLIILYLQFYNYY